MSAAAAAFFVLGVLTAESDARKAQQTPPSANTLTLEMLAREGYEVKAIQSATTRGFGFVVMMQRGPNLRTCMMRIVQGTDGRPARESVCF